MLGRSIARVPSWVCPPPPPGSEVGRAGPSEAQGWASLLLTMAPFLPQTVGNGATESSAGRVSGSDVLAFLRHLAGRPRQTRRDLLPVLEHLVPGSPPRLAQRASGPGVPSGPWPRTWLLARIHHGVTGSVMPRAGHLGEVGSPPIPSSPRPQACWAFGWTLGKDSSVSTHPLATGCPCPSALPLELGGPHWVHSTGRVSAPLPSCGVLSQVRHVASGQALPQARVFPVRGCTGPCRPLFPGSSEERPPGSLEALLTACGVGAKAAGSRGAEIARLVCRAHPCKPQMQFWECLPVPSRPGTGCSF